MPFNNFFNDINQPEDKPEFKEEKSLLGKIGWLLQRPQSMITSLFATGDPFKGWNETYYPSEEMGIKNPVLGLATDVILDPINLIGGVGAIGKAGKVGSATEKLAKFGLTVEDIAKTADKINDINHLAETIAKSERGLKKAFEFSKRYKQIADKVPELIKTVPKMFEEYGGDIEKLKKALITGELKDYAFMSNIKATKFWNADNIDDIIKGLDNIGKNSLRASEKWGSKTARAEEITNTVKTLFTPKEVEAVNEGINIFKKTGKLPDTLSYSEKVKQGLAGVGIGAPFGIKTGFKTIAPELQGKAAELITKGLEATKIPEALGKTFEPVSQTLKTLKNNISKIKQGRAMETEIGKTSEALGNIYTWRERALSDFINTGGKITEDTQNLMKTIGIDINKYKTGDEILGFSSLAGKIAEKVAANPEDVNKVIMQIIEKPQYVSKIEDVAKLPIWERIGIDGKVATDVMKEITNPEIQKTIELNRDLMSKILEKEAVAAKTYRGKNIAKILQNLKSDKYLMHKLTPEALQYASKNKDFANFVVKGILDYANSSWKKRKLLKSSEDFFDKLIDFASHDVEALNDFLKQLDPKTAEEFKNFLIKTNKKLFNISSPTERASKIANEISKKFFYTGETGDITKVGKELIKKGISEPMTIPEANAWFKKSYGVNFNLFQEDLSEILNARMRRYFQTQGRYLYTDTMAEDLLKKGLAKTAPLKSEQIPEGWVKGRFGKFRNYIFPKEVANLIRDTYSLTFKHIQALDYAKEVGALPLIVKANQKLIQWWKKITTLPFTAFHLRNAFGNLFLMWESGMPVNDIYKFYRFYGTPIMMDIAKNGKITLDKLPDLITKTGQKIAGSDLLKMLKASEVSGGFYAKELGEVGGKGILKDVAKGKLLRAGGTTAEAIEGSARASAFIWALKEGMSPENAIKYVNKTLFDYGNVPHFVEIGRRNVLPFMSWYYYNLPKQLEIVMKRPYLLNAITKTREISKKHALKEFAPFEGGYGRDRFVVYLPSNPLTYALGKTASKWFSMPLESWLPLLDVNKIDNAPSEFISMLAPQLKEPIEQAANINFALGKKAIERYPGEKVVKFGLPMSARLWHGISSFVRPISVAQYVNPLNVFGTAEKPSVFGYTQTNPYVGKVPQVSRLWGMATGLKLYNPSIDTDIKRQIIKLQQKKWVIERDIKRRLSEGKTMEMFIAEREKLDKQIKALENALQKYYKQQEQANQLNLPQ